jgi:hypothetical protein
MHFLAPNAAGQLVPIMISGGDAVAGVDLFVQLGDGGAAVGGVDVGPTITNLDLAGEAIFAANNTGVFVDPKPLIWGSTTTTQSGTVAAAGRLATLTIDTTGIASGRFNLLLNPPATGPTQLVGAPTTLVNGWLQVGAASAAADFDGDGDVDAVDLATWKTGFGALAAATHGQGDADGDGDVDGADFLVWQRQLRGVGAATAASSVPEPRSWMIAILGAAIAWLWRAPTLGCPTVRSERLLGLNEAS